MRSALQKGERLIVLKDQTTVRKISPDLFGVRARDLSWNAYLDSFQKANKAYLDALDVELIYSAGMREIEVSLRAKGTVGAVPVRAPDSHKIVGGIIVEPRYGWRSVGCLLSEIGWSAVPEILPGAMVPGSAQEIPPWVIAGPAVARIESLIKERIPGFRRRVETRTTPRGQILWNQYCSQQLPRGEFHRLPCEFSDLDVDEYLFRCIRWTLEEINKVLIPHLVTDVFARNLSDKVEQLIYSLGPIRPTVPNQNTLALIARERKHSKSIFLGLESIRWVLEKRGLAGLMSVDGLSWRLPMHELFERWVVSIVSKWASQFGGRVVTGQTNASLSRILWNHSSYRGLQALVPDVVVQTSAETFIFDAKYKAFLDDVDERQFANAEEFLRKEHRHDVHQVLAYASLFQSEKIVSVLMYPMRFNTWERLKRNNLDVSTGSFSNANREIQITIVAVPLEFPNEVSPRSIFENWNRF